MLPTVRQYAIEKNISEQTVRRWIKDGRLPIVRMGPRMMRINIVALGLMESRSKKRSETAAGEEHR